MKIGLGSGARGAEVKRLHRVLNASGLPVDAAEVSASTFGESTLRAIHDLQRRQGLPRADVVDRETLEVLLELEQNTTINVYEGGGTPPTPKPDEHHGRVDGKLVDEDGSPIPGRKVVLFVKLLRSESQLGEATTSAQGTYVIRYHRREALNLLVRAYDDAGAVIAQSPTFFAAAAQTEIDLTKDGIVRLPSAFTTLQAKVVAQLHGTPLLDLKENKDTHELQFSSWSAFQRGWNLDGA